MTCIVGVVGQDGSIVLGGDSLGVGGIDVLVRDDKKVFKKGQFLFGCTGSYRELQLVQHALRIPKPPESPARDHLYMCTTFVDKLRNTLKKAGALKEKSGVQAMESAIIVGFRGTLYIIEEDFQVGIASHGYASVGCGSPYAMGSLFAMYAHAPSDSVEDSRCGAEQALSAAVEFSGGVRPPFTYVELKGKK